MQFDGFWYRAEVRHYSIADEWGDHDYTSTQIVWSKFAVQRETPKGVFLVEVSMGTTNVDFYRRMDIHNFLLGPIFVLGKATRQRACPTKELALADCLARKERHIWGCRYRLSRAEKDREVILQEQQKLNGQGCLI